VIGQFKNVLVQIFCCFGQRKIGGNDFCFTALISDRLPKFTDGSNILMGVENDFSPGSRKPICRCRTNSARRSCNEYRYSSLHWKIILMDIPPTGNISPTSVTLHRIRGTSLTSCSFLCHEVNEVDTSMRLVQLFLHTLRKELTEAFQSETVTKSKTLLRILLFWLWQAELIKLGITLRLFGYKYK